MDKKMPIVTFCGSSNFRMLFNSLSTGFEREGFVILRPQFPDSPKELCENVMMTLSDVHHKKILLSDAILVINDEDYIGLSTLEEIMFAHNNNIRIYFLSKPESYAIKNILTYIGIDYTKTDIYELLEEKQEPPKTE